MRTKRQDKRDRPDRRLGARRRPGWRETMGRLGLGLAALAALPGVAAANCGSAFCSLNTDWAGQGLWTEPGLRLDLRYETIQQDRLRKGSDTISLDEAEAKDEGLDHLEKKTVNQNLILTADYAFNANWGMAVSVPYVDRHHEHVELDHPAGESGKETFDYRELGDLRVTGRYVFADPDAFLPPPRTWGVEFGLKLPTGRTDFKNGEGEKAERTLQPGTGTTDAILGGFVSQRLPNPSSSLFAKLNGQQPLAERDHYASGLKLNLDGGYRYQATQSLGLMAQVNLLWKAKDRGSQAEPEDSGGTFLYASPGLSFAATSNFQLYGFYQVPLYQDVNGIQLTADSGIVVGAGARF